MSMTRIYLYETNDGIRGVRFSDDAPPKPTLCVVPIGEVMAIKEGTPDMLPRDWSK